MIAVSNRKYYNNGLNKGFLLNDLTFCGIFTIIKNDDKNVVILRDYAYTKNY